MSMGMVGVLLLCSWLWSSLFVTVGDDAPTEE